MTLSLSDPPFVTIKDFGAVGDAVADDTAAFQRARQHIKGVAASRAGTGTGGGNSAGVTIFLPHGDYKITAAQALMDNDTTIISAQTTGITWRGEAGGGTRILYRPATAGPLLYNPDLYCDVGFEDLTFDCNDANSDFWESHSAGHAKFYYFTRCTWSGSWRYGLWLKGTNNNDICRWWGCFFFGAWTTFLYSQDSDQFLQFWFERCAYWSSSQLALMAKGGHLHVSHCDFSGYNPATPTYLIKLLGQFHSEGISSCSIRDCRFELFSYNAKVLYSEWSNGNVLIDGCDFTPLTFQVGNAFAPIYVNFNNTVGPVYRISNSQLAGQLAVEFNVLECYTEPQIIVDNCQIVQYERAADFVNYVLTGGHTNIACRPVVRFRNCNQRVSQGSGSTALLADEVFDSDVGWHLNVRGASQTKTLSLRMPWGEFPNLNQSVTVKLPLNSLIKRVTWFTPPNSPGAFAAAYHWTLKTAETTPTVLDQVSGSSYAAGVSQDTAVLFFCDTDLKRTLTLADAQNISAAAFTSFCNIEYIG